MQKFYLILLISLLWSSSAYCLGEKLIDLFNTLTGRDSSEELLESAIDFARKHTTAEEIFETSKQLLTGYKLEAVFSAVNKMCHYAMTTKNLRPRITPNINELQLVLKTTTCYSYSFPLVQMNTLLNSPAFDRTKKTVILIAGWLSSVNSSEIVDAMAKAYNCRGDVNFLVMDTSRYVNTLYTWSAFNTETVGDYLANALVYLSQYIPIENIHLIGHSLGAHIAGSAGRNFFNYTQRFLPRITGLDPAKPCFNEGAVLTGLSRGDADFVDVIHSNTGVLGKRESIGDADFYPDGLGALPNGCDNIICAHERAWRYYVETVYPGNERNFLAVRCNSLENLRNNRCQGQQQIMGYAAWYRLKGNFFLECNAVEPFGMQANFGVWRNTAYCGLCRG